MYKYTISTNIYNNYCKKGDTRNVYTHNIVVFIERLKKKCKIIKENLELYL